jgi:tetratricopeptide (TPR) repeat protein
MTRPSIVTAVAVGVLLVGTPIAFFAIKPRQQAVAASIAPNANTVSKVAPVSAGPPPPAAVAVTPTPAPVAAAAKPASSPSSAAPAARAARASADDGASDDLRVARAKMDAHLDDQALSDLKAIQTRTTAGASASAAYLMAGTIYERQGRVDDAMTAYVELRAKFGTSPSAAEATYRLADLTLRTKRDDREHAAMALFDEAAQIAPKSPWAPRSLMRKAALEEHAKTRIIDAQLATSVPTALVTQRLIVEQYPDAEGADASFDRLARFYDDLKRYELEAQTLENLATHFPNNRVDAAWRAGEIYEKRLKQADPARAAYANVPQSSSHYRDAQKKITQSKP